MNIRIHVSRPNTLPHTPSKKVWLLPDSICQKCALILGGDPENPNSIPIRKGYLTQSQTTIQIMDLLASLGREYIEVPVGREIHYRRALIRGGFEYIFEQIHGAWTFDSLSGMLLDGYTHEKTDAHTGQISSIGNMRKRESSRSDGGPRYLLAYNDEKKKYADISDILEFEQDPESAQKICDSSDELAQMIF